MKNLTLDIDINLVIFGRNMKKQIINGKTILKGTHIDVPLVSPSASVYSKGSMIIMRQGSKSDSKNDS